MEDPRCQSDSIWRGSTRRLEGSLSCTNRSSCHIDSRNSTESSIYLEVRLWNCRNWIWICSLDIKTRVEFYLSFKIVPVRCIKVILFVPIIIKAELWIDEEYVTKIICKCIFLFELSILGKICIHWKFYLHPLGIYIIKHLSNI